MLCLLSEFAPKLDYSYLKDFIADIGKLKQEDYGGPIGPRRVTQAEIKGLFRDGWRINYIRQATMEIRIDPAAGHAAGQGWLSSISKGWAELRAACSAT